MTWRLTLPLSALVLLTACGNGEGFSPTALPRPAEVAPVVVDLPEAPTPTSCKGYVALTFDDGPTDLTRDYLAVLAHYDVPAAFFTIGAQEAIKPRDVERITADGHQLGNHTMSHPDLLSLTLDQALLDVAAWSDAHQELGHDASALFRPPFGATSAEIRKAVEGQGMVEVLWTVDSKDFEATSPKLVLEKSVGMTDGGILLLHEGKPNTLKALPEIIAHYHEQGLCFGSVGTADVELATDLGTTHRARAVSR